jgi:phosphate transport system permease protein
MTMENTRSNTLGPAWPRPLAQLERRPLAVAIETAIEVVIRLCGISAVLFVFGIFFFVFREGAPFLLHGFDARQFFLSIEWYPTSQSHVRYGVLALIAGTSAVTALAMVLAVPFGIGAAIHLRVLPAARP